MSGRAIKENVDMDELISKMAVIEAIEKARANVGHNMERAVGAAFIEILDEVGEDIGRLPSAQPTFDARDTQYNLPIGTDCISRQAAIMKILGQPPELHYPSWYAEQIKELPSAQPEVKQISYIDCANAMLMMWMDKVLTDGEYNRIMDKLNEHEKKKGEDNE